MKGIKIMAAIAVAAMMIAVPVSIANDSSAADIKDSNAGMSFTASDKSIGDMQKITDMNNVYSNILSALGFNTSDYEYEFKDTGSKNLGIKIAAIENINSDGNCKSISKYLPAFEYSGFISFTATIDTIYMHADPFFNTEGLSTEDEKATTEYFGTPVAGDKITISGDFDISMALIENVKFERISDDSFIITTTEERVAAKVSCNLKGSFNDNKSFEYDNSNSMDATITTSMDFKDDLKNVKAGTTYDKTVITPAMSEKTDFKLGDKTYTRTEETKEKKEVKEGLTVKNSDIMTSSSIVIEKAFTMDDLKRMLGTTDMDVNLADYGEVSLNYDGANSVVDDIIGSGSKDSKLPLIIGGVAAVVVIAGIVAFVILRNKA